MAGEIKGIDGSRVAPAEVGRKTAGAERPAARTGNDAPADEVSLTDTAARLRELEARLAELPVVDSKRVDEIRQLIAEGRYQVDAGDIAEKLIQIEKLLDDMGG